MKTLLALITLISINAQADTYVNGHLKSDGTYVEGYWRSDSNGNYYDNYSSKGNVNPWTGDRGSRSYESYQNNQNQYQYGTRKRGW